MDGIGDVRWDFVGLEGLLAWQVVTRGEWLSRAGLDWGCVEPEDGCGDHGGGEDECACGSLEYGDAGRAGLWAWDRLQRLGEGVGEGRMALGGFAAPCGILDHGDDEGCVEGADAQGLGGLHESLAAFGVDDGGAASVDL